MPRFKAPRGFLGAPGDELPWPIDATALTPALGWLRATKPRAALGSTMRRFVAGPGPGGSEATMQGLFSGSPGGPASVDWVRNLVKQPLKQSRAMGDELTNFLRGEGHTGVSFMPVNEGQGVASRVRLFEYLLGGRRARALPDDPDHFFIPFD